MSNITDVYDEWNENVIVRNIGDYLYCALEDFNTGIAIAFGDDASDVYNESITKGYLNPVIVCLTNVWMKDVSYTV
jgi:hypothetical protein